MDFDDAIECDEVTVAEALRELRKHGCACGRVGGHIWVNDPCTDFYGKPVNISYVIKIDAQGHVRGRDVLEFLGY